MLGFRKNKTAEENDSPKKSGLFARLNKPLVPGIREIPNQPG